MTTVGRLLAAGTLIAASHTNAAFGADGGNGSQERPGMDAPCDGIRKNTSLSVEIKGKRGARHLVAAIVNGGQDPLWIPQVATPAYQIDRVTKTVVVSYGYFEDVYGPHKGHYMLPAMRKVAPQQKYRWEIRVPEIVAAAVIPGFQVKLQVRAALREFRPSRVRGEGARDLPAYLAESCVLQGEPRGR